MVPLTGITLPFVSYGGTAMIAALASVAKACLCLYQEVIPPLRNLANPVTDLLSVLGGFKKVPDLFIALPGDAGYTLGPVCARLLADTLLGRPAEHPLEDFSPDRFAVRS